MSAAAGPDIIENGLILCLDAANRASYSSVGTAWNDLTKPDGSLSVVQVLVVAGGGGGGMDMGGGGGGGGVIYSSSHIIIPDSAITVTVGNGGAGAPAGGTNGQPSFHQFTISATQGGNSVFGSLTAIGGGFGASSYYGYLPNNGFGGTGGSGGGCSGYTHGGERYVDGTNGSTANNIEGQGFVGGNSGDPSSGGDDHYSGGGGGAGGRGTSGPNHTGPNGVRADGGPGVCYPSISPYYFAGGGGGSGFSGNGGYGGIGGGGGGSASNGNVGLAGTGGINIGSNGSSGNNAPGGNAAANTGGGGGGGSYYNVNNKGGDGGSGIVIVRYTGSQKATGGTVTSVGGDTVHTFTTSGTFTPNLLPGTGILTNGVGYTGPYSANGGNLIFDGTDDYIQTLITGTYTQISFDFWSFFDDPTLNVLSRQESIFGDWNSNRVHFATRWTGSDAGIHFNVNGAWQTTPPTYLKYGWNHYTVIYDTVSNLKQVYLNSILSSSHSTGGNMVIGDFKIGVATDLNQYYRGNISNFKIYNRALTPAEVFQNYNATKPRFNFDQSNFGSLNNPLPSPVFAQNNNFPAGSYYFSSGSMSSPLLLEYQPSYYENKPFCCVFRSPYRSTATTNRINLNIPMGGLLVQRDTLDLRAAVYWSTPITYNGVYDNTADSGYSPRRVMLGGSGGHGIYATNQGQCGWATATGAIGAGWDGSTCGSFPNDLVWGTGRSDTATYENRFGVWSHWITWS